MENHSIHILFSNTSQLFLKKCTTYCREILYKDVGLHLKTRRFVYKGYSYPLHLVIFEGGSKLGYFDSSLMEIGLSKKLTFVEDDLLIEVIQHEIVHLITFLEYGNLISHHGPEFRQICTRYGWKESMSATIEESVLEKKSERIHSKILKLFDLASSKNPFEAKNALTKARSLMIKHKLDSVTLDEEDFVIVRTLESNRATEKMRAISTILRAFFVYPVINHARGKVYLEIFGEKNMIEIGEYLAHTLNHKLDELWEEELHLFGMRAKNSFYRGIAEGFVNELNTASSSNGLIKIDKILEKNARSAYPHLSRAKATSTIDLQALRKGRSVGSQLRLPKGIKKTASSLVFALQNKFVS